MKSCNSFRSGSALIIILPIIAILTLIILTVLSIALFDSHLASNSMEQARAGSIVKYAIDDVSDKLYQIPLDRHWAAGPGHIRYWDGVSNWTNIELYSGTNGTTPAAGDYLDGATAATAAKCVQLNVPLADGSYSIMSINNEYPTAPNMTVKWIYVLQDGTIQTDPTQLPNSGVIGRYGYWTDVENGRVNINTAGFGMVNPPTDRFHWRLETWPMTPATSPATYLWNATNVQWANGYTGTPQDSFATYTANVLIPNPWLTDKLQSGTTTPITFTNTTYPSLVRFTAQTNSIQNLTGHPSSIDLSYLDFDPSVTATQMVQQSFDTFRYAGSYFLRVDALNSVSILEDGAGDGQVSHYTNTVIPISPTPSPDVSIRFFNDPSDWQLIVDSATYARNKGYLTVKGRSPEINPWGLPKIPLSEAAHEGLALNDLTEIYLRTVPSNFINTGYYNIGEATQDSRQVQVPDSFDGLDGMSWYSSSLVTPPFPLFNNVRSNFRDLTSSDYGNTPFVATLINDLKNTFNTPMPGFSQSLGQKYATQYATTPPTPTPPALSTQGECEQVAVEIMTFVDSCLNDNYPGYGPWSTSPNGPDFSGGGIAMSAQTSDPNPGINGSTHRIGSNGTTLINELAMQAGVVPYSYVSGYTAMTTNQVSSMYPATTLPTPYGYYSGQYNASGVELFLLRQPTAGTPITNIGAANPPITNIIAGTPPTTNIITAVTNFAPTSPDTFIALSLLTEATVPPHFGYTSPMNGQDAYLNYPQGALANTVIQYTIDGSTFTPIAYDMNSSTDGSKSASARYWPGEGSGAYWGPNGADGGAQEVMDLFPGFAPSGPSYNPNQSTYYAVPSGPGNPGIVIGPFAPVTGGHTVELKVSTEFVLYPHTYGGAWNPGATFISQYFPGILTDYAQLTSVQPSQMSSQFLEFDFTVANGLAINTTYPLAPEPTISLEATDPRVTRNKTDWKVSSVPGGTLGAPNSTLSTAPDMSKLARPPNHLQFARGLFRAKALTPANNGGSYPQQPEFQNASRILGLPGVGYLSEVPTGVDSGKSWATMKFHSNTDNPPDWLLWNLFYVPFDRSMANQTDGKLNINAQLYPFQTTSGTPLLREKPLEALIGNRVTSSTERTSIATAIANGPPSITGANLPSDLYMYAGEICQVAGVADGTGSTGTDEFTEEHITRDIADIVTTQSSDYRVFVVAQTLKQSSSGQISPVSTQRVETTLSREVDFGNSVDPYGDKPLWNYTIGNYDSESSPFYFYYRQDYRDGSGNIVPLATRTRTWVNQAGSHVNGYSYMSIDHTPTGAHNWLIPQKIEISRYKIIK